MDDAEEKDRLDRGDGRSNEFDPNKLVFRVTLACEGFLTPVVYALSRTPWLDSDDNGEFCPLKETKFSLIRRSNNSILLIEMTYP